MKPTNEKFIDLHLHTTFSDGAWTPTQVVQNALKANLSAIAITDHDNLDGIQEAKDAALAASAGGKEIEVIAGVELSTYSDFEEQEIHILGYFFGDINEGLIKRLDFFRQARLKRAYDIVKKLKENNVVLKDLSFIENSGKSSVGRLHFAKALLKENFVTSIQEAFQKYIGFNCPAYVEKTMLTSKEAIELISKFGGISVIAHPYYTSGKETIKHLADQGLQGIEAYHIKHSPKAVEEYLNIAIEYDLVATGGSDCHGDYDGKRNGPVLGTLKIPQTCLKNLKKLL
jgi:predicted metal-dependent phosphoesterase TrpH